MTSTVKKPKHNILEYRLIVYRYHFVFGTRNMGLRIVRFYSCDSEKDVDVLRTEKSIGDWAV